MVKEKMENCQKIIYEICEEIVKTGKKLIESHLTVGTWGNISARIPDTEWFAITPSGMDYETLNAKDIVIVDKNGNKIAGERKPSVELPLHRMIYQHREDIKAIVHTHSPYATAMAVARKGIPGALEDLVQIAGGDVRVTEYALPGSEELGINTVKALEGRNAVLLANHGMLGGGRTLAEALKICQVVEKGAQVMLLAQLIGGPVKLPEEDIRVMRDFYLHGYGQK